MALSASSVWEVRTAGNDTNGGGFVTGASGTDYSQQDSKNTVGTDISTVDGVANGTTTFTSATANFGTSIVGNIIYVTGGTGSITGVWRQVTARASSTSITLDAAVAASTGMTLNIGGALASPGQAGASLVAGNVLWIKAGTYSITSATINISGGCPSLVEGSGGSVQGYQTTRGDLGTPPLLQASGISTATLLGNQGTNNGFAIVNINVDGAGLTAITGFKFMRFPVYYKCGALNCSNNGFQVGGNFPGSLIQCYATGCSLQPAISLLNGGSAFACEAYSNTISGFSIGAGASCFNCISYLNSGASSDGFGILSNNGGCNFSNCTSYSNGGKGFNNNSVLGHGVSFVNCIAESNTGIGFFAASPTVAAAMIMVNCATYNNTGGTFTAGMLVNTGFVTNTTGSFFVNAASGNFALNATVNQGALARATGVPGLYPDGLTTGYLDRGAAQHQDSGGGASTIFVETANTQIVERYSSIGY